MAEASGAGVLVDGGQVPVGAGARAVAAMHGGDPLVLALDGGEDYELLMAVPPARWEELASVLEAAGTPVTRIGEVVPRAAGLVLRDPTGHMRPLPEAGYEHFRAR
jgi:thiamine-monophosphate kinase